MSHWLEEAERHKHRKQRGSTRLHEKIYRKREEIQNNYHENREAYESFVFKLYEFVDRVNELPFEKRKDFGKIDSRQKTSKLDNRLNIFSSSIRMKRRKKKGLLPMQMLKLHHYKHIRVIFVNVSRHYGYIEMELKDHVLRRSRMKDSEKRGNKEDKENKDHESGDQEKFHVLFNFPMNKLNEEISLEIIDWLAFKQDLGKCNFYTMIPEKNKVFF